MSDYEKKSAIMALYDLSYELDWLKPTQAESEAGDKWIKKFFEDHTDIDKDSKLGVEIANLATDYMAENMRYGFKNGFITGVRLIMEVFAHE